MYSPGVGFVVPPKEAMTTTPPLFSGRVLNCGGVGGGVWPSGACSSGVVSSCATAVIGARAIVRIIDVSRSMRIAAEYFAILDNCFISFVFETWSLISPFVGSCK